MASVVQTQHHNLIYDVGTRYSETYDIGKLVVVPFLKAKGITAVNSMILSHKDIDHWGGAEAVLKEISVNEIMSSDLSILPRQETLGCTKGKHWQWDGVDFEFLSPSDAFLKTSKKDNNRSCVLRVSNANHSLLLTGDIEKKAEKTLLKNDKNKLSSEVITVPHHGSKTSSTKLFIEATSPKLALIPTGYRNRFGHPKDKVLNRYNKLEIPVMDTVNSGAITIIFPKTEKKYQLNSYRLQKRGFWSR
jgi:competence protein ComEC